MWTRCHCSSLWWRSRWSHRSSCRRVWTPDRHQRGSRRSFQQQHSLCDNHIMPPRSSACNKKKNCIKLQGCQKDLVIKTRDRDAQWNLSNQDLYKRNLSIKDTHSGPVLWCIIDLHNKDKFWGPNESTFTIIRSPCVTMSVMQYWNQ